MGEAKRNRKRRTTERAVQALRTDDEATFNSLFAESDVAMKIVFKRFKDGVEVETDLFSAACYGITLRKTDDLARRVAVRMIAESMDLRTHRTNVSNQFTTLMMAAACCGVEVVKLLLPHSDPDAVSLADGLTADALAEEMGRHENAECIRAHRHILNEAQELEAAIPRQGALGCS